MKKGAGFCVFCRCSGCHVYKTRKNWHLCSYVGRLYHIQPGIEKSVQCAKMTTGITRQKTLEHLEGRDKRLV
jgi:hypothetical protein